MSLPPRIRGKVGQAEDGQGVDGKWFFSIFVATFYGENIGEPIGPFGPFDTEQKAMEEMRQACQKAAEVYEVHETGKTSGKYMDMLNGGVLRTWDEN
jgi:hypothetical protein